MIADLERTALTKWRQWHGRLWAAAVLSLAATALVVPAARAEYDSQGRYVPSPMGKPSDPYRSYVPLYTGKPGGSKRQPITPPAYEMKPLTLPRFDPPKERSIYRARPRVARPSRQDCLEGWSKKTGIPRARFKRACRVLLSQPEKEVP